MNLDHPDYSMIEIGQNSQESPGNLRRLAVIQTPEKANADMKDSQRAK